MLHYFLTAIRSTAADRKGVTAAEYAVLAVGVIIVVAGAVSLFGSSLNTAFTNIGLQVVSAAPAPAGR